MLGLVGRQEEGLYGEMQDYNNNMVLYTKVVITTTITTTVIINTKRVKSKKFPNILSLRRTIPFQLQLKIHIYVYLSVYKCIYI